MKTDAELADLSAQRSYSPPADTVKLVAAARWREQPAGSDLTDRELRPRAEEMVEQAVQSRDNAREERRAELTARMRELRRNGLLHVLVTGQAAAEAAKTRELPRAEFVAVIEHLLADCDLGGGSDV